MFVHQMELILNTVVYINKIKFFGFKPVQSLVLSYGEPRINTLKYTTRISSNHMKDAPSLETLKLQFKLIFFKASYE